MEITLGNSVIFTVFILPIQEHSEFLHLFVLSLDSFVSVIVFRAQVFCIGLLLCILFSVYTFQEWSIFLPVSLIELLQLNPSGLQSEMFWKLLLGAMSSQPLWADQPLGECLPRLGSISDFGLEAGR